MRAFNRFKINILEGTNGGPVTISEEWIFKFRETNCGFKYMYMLVKF